jgi:hypothetical protein
MASGGLPVERLRDFLRQLPAGSRALLIAELERAVLRGDEIPGGDFLLQEVRSAVRASAEPAPRVDEPSRHFFRAIEPFLVDESDPAHKHLGRIGRTALDPLWAWISRDLAPDEATIYCDDLTRALVAGGAEICEPLTRAFQDHVAACIRNALDAAKADDKLRRRTAGQIGTPNAFDDVRSLLTILAGRSALDLIAGRLPGHLRNFAYGSLENAKQALDTLLGAQRELLPHALVLVMGRLAAPWQLIRLAVQDAESDDVVRIVGSPYAPAVTIVLEDMERMVGELRNDLKRGSLLAVTSLIKCIHDSARGLRTELDLAGDSPWSRKLAAIRSEIADLLKTEIESTPGRVRRLLRPRPSSEIARGGAKLDSDDVAETEALIEFVGACRNYAGELAISEMTLRAFHELQQYLETGTQQLVDSLRGASDADRSFRQSQVDAAVRFCAKVFGHDYAALLGKAAEVAANAPPPERKAAAKG